MKHNRHRRTYKRLVTMTMMWQKNKLVSAVKDKIHLETLSRNSEHCLIMVFCFWTSFHRQLANKKNIFSTATLWFDSRECLTLPTVNIAFKISVLERARDAIFWSNFKSQNSKKSIIEEADILIFSLNRSECIAVKSCMFANLSSLSRLLKWKNWW